MLPLIAAIFTASLLGSLHCAGMCGAFLAIALTDNNPSPSRKACTQSAYHLGRLLSYTALGAAAGSAGHLLNLAGGLAGIRPIATLLAGAAMIFFGLTTFLRLHNVHISRIPLPSVVTSLARAGYRTAMQHPPVPRAFAIGLLTTLLPCGWLYAFAITAAGTGSAPLGALTMAVFWAGTLPVLVSLGAGLQHLTGPLARRIPTLTCLALISIGFYTLVARASLDPASLTQRLQGQQTRTLPSPDSPKPCCENDDHTH